jgi:serine/threonine protein phosphatase 1
MKRILVISDIHGELAKFEALLAAAQYNSEQDQLILLGDYVDRGPVQSYGFTEADYALDENAESFAKPELQSDIVSEHLAFITKLEHYIETDDYIFVHAGVQPGLPVSETDPFTLMWIRGEFHTGYSGEKIVVFGHSSTDTLHGDSDNYHVYFGVNRIIGIDGGAVYGGQLNCLELPSQVVYNVK